MIKLYNITRIFACCLVWVWNLVTHSEGWT